MSLPDLDTFCVPLPNNNPLCITFPGGTQLCAQVASVTPPDPLAYALSLLSSASSALQPTQPIFKVLAVVVDLVNCVKAVESCLGPPPNPTKLIECFPQLADDLASLLELAPPLSVPVLIAGILQALLAFLKGLRTQILAVLQKLLRILSAQIRAQQTGSLQLQTAIACEQANLATFLAGLSTAAGPVTCLITLINELLSLIGLPTLAISLQVGLDPSTIEEILTPIDDIITILQDALALLPLGGSC